MSESDFKLSVLIAAIPSRLDMMAALFKTLREQAEAAGHSGAVELLVVLDNQAQTIAAKRNNLLRMAQGDYVAFLDDDDGVSDHYIASLIAAINAHPGVDCISFNQACTIDGRPMRVRFGMGNPHENLRHAEDGTLADIRRPPYHVCAWRRALAQSEVFAESYTPSGQSNEDLHWLMRLYPKVQTEHHIEEALHHYVYDSGTTDSRRSPHGSPPANTAHRAASSEPDPGRALTLSGTAHGVAITVEVSDRRWLNQVKESLPLGFRAGPYDANARRYSLILADDELRQVGRSRLLTKGALVLDDASVSETLLRFHSDARLYIAEMAVGRLFVHAGVVASRGRAIVLPGRSFSGKSTLVAALVKAGAVYYSDEYAVFDEDGLVRAYPDPLSIRNVDGATKKVRVEEFGGIAGSVAIPTALVITCQYRQGGRFDPRALSPGQSILRLLSNTVAVRRSPKSALAVLKETVVTSRHFHSERGDAVETAREILRLAEAGT